MKTTLRALKQKRASAHTTSLPHDSETLWNSLLSHAKIVNQPADLIILSRFAGN